MSREIAEEEKRVKISWQYSCKSSTLLEKPFLLLIIRRDAAANSKKHIAREIRPFGPYLSTHLLECKTQNALPFW